MVTDTDNLEFSSGGPEATESLGFRLGARLRAGDLIFLEGDLGGGKTTFTRGVVRGTGHPEPREVSSPSYALHHRYEGGRVPIDHLDLYRLDPDEGSLDRQGILDPVRGEGAGAILIEWPQRWPDRETPDLSVFFDYRGESEREIRIEARSDRGEALISAMKVRRKL